jgi:hypothetical protein
MPHRPNNAQGFVVGHNQAVPNLKMNLSSQNQSIKPMQAIKQYTEVINGSIHIDLPKDFTAKRVELIILSADDDADSGGFQRFLLDSPEMSDEEYQTIEEKRQHLNQWS